eukprot:s5623_g1.t1
MMQGAVKAAQERAEKAATKVESPEERAAREKKEQAYAWLLEYQRQQAEDKAEVDRLRQERERAEKEVKMEADKRRKAEEAERLEREWQQQQREEREYEEAARRSEEEQAEAMAKLRREREEAEKMEAERRRRRDEEEQAEIQRRAEQLKEERRREEDTSSQALRMEQQQQREAEDGPGVSQVLPMASEERPVYDLGAIRETSAATLDFFRDSAMDWELVLTGPARQRQPGRQLKEALKLLRTLNTRDLPKARVLAKLVQQVLSPFWAPHTLFTQPSHCHRLPLALEWAQESAGSDETSLQELSQPYSRWHVGDQVDRLVDDFADMWIGAVVQFVRPGGLYDIVYVDTGAVETNVEAEELRCRCVPCPLGSELWELLCTFASDGPELCAYSRVERVSRAAAERHGQVLWSILYHSNFGRCGSRCALERPGEADLARARPAAAACRAVCADPAQSPLPRQRLPWKDKYAERFVDLRREQLLQKLLVPGPPAAAAGAFGRRGQDLDGRLRFGKEALRGSVYDPMLGKMVSEDGGYMGHPNRAQPRLTCIMMSPQAARRRQLEEENRRLEEERQRKEAEKRAEAERTRQRQEELRRLEEQRRAFERAEEDHSTTILSERIKAKKHKDEEARRQEEERRRDEEERQRQADEAARRKELQEAREPAGGSGMSARTMMPGFSNPLDSRLDMLEMELQRLKGSRQMGMTGGMTGVPMTFTQPQQALSPIMPSGPPMYAMPHEPTGPAPALANIETKNHGEIMQAYKDIESQQKHNDLLQRHSDLTKHHVELMRAHQELLESLKKNGGGGGGGAPGQPQKKKTKHPALGVVRLDYDYPPAPGDSDHPGSFGYEVYYRCCPGLTFEMCQEGHFPEAVERRFADAIKHLEARGCAAITGDCGFMMAFHMIARKIAAKPIFMSSMVQCPIIAAALEPSDQILLLTANDRHLKPQKQVLLSSCGFDVDEDRFLIKGCQSVPGFEAVALGGKVPLEVVQPGIVKLVQETRKQHPRIAAILLECTELPPYADALRYHTGLPVWDAVTAADFYISAHQDNPRFGHNDWQEAWDGTHEEYELGINLTKDELSLVVSRFREI